MRAILTMRKYAKAYHDVLFNGHLTPSEKLVFIYLTDLQGKNDASWHKQQSIADKLSIGRQHVNKCLGQLEQYGLITIDRQKHSIFYTVVNCDTVTINDTVAICDTHIYR